MKNDLERADVEAGMGGSSKTLEKGGYGAKREASLECKFANGLWYGRPVTEFAKYSKGGSILWSEGNLRCSDVRALPDGSRVF